MGPLISTHDLTKTFDGHEVVNKCSIQVNQGEIYGFLGVNGAGKTTVLKLMLGLLRPTAGSVEILGHDVTADRLAIAASIGSIIEVPIFYEHLSAYENLSIHLAYLGITDTSTIEGTLSRVGLPNTGTQKVSQFSLGMRQRLGIARAMIHKPRIMLLDEPINGLDPVAIRDMRELLLSLAKDDGITIIISSHILTEIERIADRVGVIANGTIIEEFSMSSMERNHPEGMEDYVINLMSGKAR
ncbi:ABC transporter ATP-binding protein [Bifidobacterium aquikefiricola]|uniref:ATP-binding cassette domain-containing protein n=1 Tax=Bifidobacterium aquikefiricola TaxID=3059038 RepID=A0AB39U500_9BIFI